MSDKCPTCCKPMAPSKLTLVSYMQTETYECEPCNEVFFADYVKRVEAERQLADANARAEKAEAACAAMHYLNPQPFAWSVECPRGQEYDNRIYPTLEDAERDSEAFVDTVIDDLPDVPNGGLEASIVKRFKPLPLYAINTTKSNPGQAILNRLAQAEAIVAKLPKTADGVPVVPGINLYCAGSDREWVGDCVAFDRSRPTTTMNPEFLYSTRAAADAAQTKPDDWARDHRLDSHGKVQP